MEQYAAKQLEHGREIQRIISNFKKDGPERRKASGYFESRRIQLEQLWIQFEEVDNKIREVCPVATDHEYFKKEYYKEISELVQRYMNIFDAALTGETDQNEDSSQKQVQSRPLNQSEKSEVTSMIRKQRAMISSLQRLLSRLSRGLEEHSKEYLDVQRKTLARLWQQVEELNYSIYETADNPENSGYNASEYDRVEDAAREQLALLGEKTELQELKITTPKAVNLPKITIEKFDGDYLKWPQFVDMFSQMIDKQPLSTIQKMWYLKSNVTGDAEKLISHLTMTEGNYEAAWTAMKARYSNKRVLTSALIQKLISQPNLPSEGQTAAAIRNFHDTLHEGLLALKNIGVDTSTWDPIILHIMLRKLDRQTHMLYEQSIQQPRENQTVSAFLKFLEYRFQSLEAIGRKEKHSSAKTTATATSKPEFLCKLCKTPSHGLYACKRFLEMAASERLEFVQKSKLCINCLKTGHKYSTCPSRPCLRCQRKHNTLLHLEPSAKATVSQKPPEKSSSETHQSNTKHQTSSTITSMAASQPINDNGYVLLGTARILITASNGRTIECKALLDSGSQVNLVTERLIKRLKITTSPSCLSIEGIGRERRDINRRVNVTMKSVFGQFETCLEAFVLTSIVSIQPSQTLNISTWNIPKNINLADKRFNCPEKIDVLLGAEFFHQMVMPGQIFLGDGMPILQNTVFGWILSGKISVQSMNPSTCVILTAEEETNNAFLERFWKLEEVDESKQAFTSTEKRCETHFTQNTVRTTSGRFMVKLPFLENPTTLGSSRLTAENRFHALEARLSRKEGIKQQYVDFMREYESLGHMSQVDPKSITGAHYYIPHHYVLKPESTSTKLRVVFDASTKTSSGYSLNDILHCGPVIQDDLFTILCRFRLSKYVFTTDIQKMYRQILVHSDDRKFQLIVWREDASLPLKYFALNTVIYGTRSAPYLAIKCLKKLAFESMSKYPLGAKALQVNFYVDDGLIGADNLSSAIETRQQLTTILETAGFKLQIWCANNSKLLAKVPIEEREVNLDFEDESQDSVKTLGIMWSPKTDNFFIQVTLRKSQQITKRTICSEIARVFDPLGILSPVVVTAKIIIQRLWELKISWDESVPLDIERQWTAFHKELTILTDVRIPRHCYSQQTTKTVQLHAFADASEMAYGAAIYLRSVLNDGKIVVRLLCAKSKVAPIIKTRIPRLELCAAMLSTRLVTKVKSELAYDSQIVLAWINSAASSYHTFVANRIAEIQEHSLPEQWKHVNSRDNPADVLSRGLPPRHFKSCTLWFYGPIFLHGKESTWPSLQIHERDIQEDMERKQKKHIATSAPTTTPDDFAYSINHGNNFKTLQRIVAYILRFAKNCRIHQKVRQPKDIVLDTEELDNALIIIIRQIQHSDFRTEIRNLRKGEQLPTKSPMKDKDPYLDGKGIIRVGGRLELSLLEDDRKHPIILPYNDPIVKMLLKKIHEENFHCGSQTLLNIVRERFWIVKGKIMTRSVIQKCITCCRAKPKLLNQIMGNLPSARVQPARPFLNSGVDFCGPVWVHFKIRGKKPQKAYIVVFCCFTTKAVHLELATNLTTEAFIGALKRFIGRRGHCENIYCDNATNFVGARNQLAELKPSIYSSNAQENIKNQCSSKGIQFHFIPPRAPHFGGLWEAAVKSAKHLLVRSTSKASLTYEELETVIIGIEAVLNSRPITPMSSDPNDLTALTPGHFLIGEPLVAQFERTNYEGGRGTLAERWKQVSELKHGFWIRWSKEYLNELQGRQRWNDRVSNVELGTMVILQEDNVPPMQWPLGRIMKLHYGSDGAVRVVDVKTANGIKIRAIHRLSPLPTDDFFSPRQQNTKDQEDSSPAERKGKSTLPSHSKASQQRPTTSNTINHNEPEPTRKRLKTTKGSLLTSLFCVCLATMVHSDPMIVNKQFSQRLGLHFEQIGKVAHVNSEWRIMVYYNLSTYWQEIKSFEVGIDSLKVLCGKTENNPVCYHITSQFEQMQENLRLENRIFSGQRKRRGAFNIIGNMAHPLFGVLDSEYANEIAATIENIKLNEQHILKLARNQTSIVDSTINIMKFNQRHTQNKFTEIDGKLKYIMNQISQNHSDSFQTKIMQAQTALSFQLLIANYELHRIQAAIMDILIDTHHGKISPLLLSPEQLVQELKLIRNNLPSSTQLPIEETDILHLYKVMTIQGRLVKNYLVVTICLPLVDHRKFDVFSVTPIPIKVGEILKRLKASEIFAVNAHRNSYFTMSEHELSSCNLLKVGSFICKYKGLINHQGSSPASCELSLLLTEESTSCEVENITSAYSLSQLHNKNRWIYGFKSPIRLQAVCGDYIDQIRITGSGLLSIQSNCVIKHDLFTITGDDLNASNFTTSYNGTNILVSLPLNDTQLTSPNFNSTYHPYIPSITELEKLQTSLPTEDDFDFIETNSINHHHTIPGYIALTLMVIFFIYFVWSRRVKVQRRSAIPIPAPRSTLQPDYSVEVS